jgi:hypothetical protein
MTQVNEDDIEAVHDLPYLVSVAADDSVNVEVRSFAPSR